MRFEDFGLHSRQVLQPPFLGGQVHLTSAISDGVVLTHQFSFGAGSQDPVTDTGYVSSLHVSGKKTGMALLVSKKGFLGKVARNMSSWLSVKATAQNLMKEASPFSLEADTSFSGVSASAQVSHDLSSAFSLSLHPNPAFAIGAHIMSSQGHHATSIGTEFSIGKCPCNYSIDHDPSIPLTKPRLITTIKTSPSRHVMVSSTLNVSDSLAVATEAAVPLSRSLESTLAVGYRYVAPLSGIEVRGKYEDGSVSASAEGSVIPGVKLGVGVLSNLRHSSTLTGVSLSVGE
ncbi:hypothetical protein RCL1_003496 [Eukaryota sp. TZLM3-RCL]